MDSGRNRLAGIPTESILQLLPMGACTVRAPDGAITWFNDRAAKLWGRRPAIGESIVRFSESFRLYRTDGTEIAADATPVIDALKSGTSLHEQDIVVERPDGTRVVACVHVDPIRDAHGIIVGAVSFFYDVDERRKREQAVSYQLKTLEEKAHHRAVSINRLSRHLIRLQEEEWKTMSRAVRDDATQQLVAAKVNIDVLLTALAYKDSNLLDLALEARRRVVDAIKEAESTTGIIPKHSAAAERVPHQQRIDNIDAPLLEPQLAKS